MPKGTPEVPFTLIARLASRFYPSLPPAARAEYDVDDLIQYGVLCWLEKRHLFDPSRAGLNTFVTRVVRSHFIELIRRFRRVRYPQQALAIIEDVSPEYLATFCKTERRCQVEDRVERFFRMASPGLRQFMMAYYFSGKEDFRVWTRSMEDRFRVELTWLIRRTGVTADDFRTMALASPR